MRFLLNGPAVLAFVGFGTNPDGFTESWVATIGTVPEPATISLLALGGAALLHRKRRGVIQSK